MLRLGPPRPGPAPRISVIVPCRDEAAGVERAMRSLLAQDGVELEVVAVDDRSSDGTGAILDGLAAPPSFVAPGFLERAFVTAFAALLAPLIRIADLRRPGTRAYFGVGAFNLVRRDAYARAGGHLRLPLEVVDDLKLGLLLRRSGVAQGVARSDGFVQVRWQEGFVRSVLGLVKNAFAALEYRPAVAIAGAFAAAAAGGAPLVVLVAGPGALARALAGAALAVAIAHHAAVARQLGDSRGTEGILMPVCVLLLGAVVLASAVAAWWRGGVVWRGTHYPLDRVREGCLRDGELPVSGAIGWGGDS